MFGKIFLKRKSLQKATPHFLMIVDILGPFLNSDTVIAKVHT